MNDLVEQPLGRTALFEAHLACSARIVPFAGWEMPVQYAGVKGEALAVRQGCGIFDVGHMGQLDVKGPNVTAALNRIISADWTNVPIGRAAYALLLNEAGNVQDDIMGYRLADDEWFIVVNAGRAASDEAHFRRYLPPEISLSNRYDNQAMIAVQGPQAEAVLQTLCDDDLSAFEWRDVRPATVLGHKGLLARGGYTGSDGFEWMGTAAEATPLWEALLAAGATPVWPRCPRYITTRSGFAGFMGTNCAKTGAPICRVATGPSNPRKAISSGATICCTSTKCSHLMPVCVASKCWGAPFRAKNTSCRSMVKT